MAADSIVRLKVESSEYDSKIRRARDGMLHLEQSLHKAGKSFTDLDRDQVKYIQSIGRMETSVRGARGKVNELSQSFVDLRVQYNKLTNAERQSPAGRAMAQSLDQLKIRIQSTKQELQSVTNELNQTSAKGTDFSQVLGTVGNQLGINTSLLRGGTAGTRGMTAAIGACVAAVVAATVAWANYNAEISRQTQITTVTTGLKGGDADRMTASARALAATYDVDFREVINAANTLMTQFGQNGDQSIKLLRDGLRGMILGDGPKLLSMIQQYGPAFQSAGVEASQLVAVIQNSEGGIFTDQNMQAIIMGLARIRNMSESTATNLSKIGLNADEMRRKMRDGSMSVFEALQMVSKAIDNNKDNTEAVGAVMQDVFGRQARTAGDNLGKAIAELNTNLEITKRQTGDIGKSFDDLYVAKQRLEEQLSKTFNTGNWDQMVNEIKGTCITALANVLDILNRIKNVKIQIADTSGLGKLVTWAQDLGKYLTSCLVPMIYIYNRLKDFNDLYDKVFRKLSDFQITPPGWTPGNEQPLSSPLNRWNQDGTPRVYGGGNVIHRGNGGGNTHTVPAVKTEEQIRKEQIEALTKEYLTASEERRSAIIAEIADLKRLNAEYERLKAEATGGKKSNEFSISGQKTVEFGKPAYNEMLKQQEASLFTSGNLATLTTNLKKELQSAEIGSEIYSSLTAQLADATALGNLITTSIKNGIDVADWGAVEFWQKILNDGNIDDSILQNALDKINEQLVAKGLAPLSMNFNTGDLNSEKSNNKKPEQTGLEQFIDNFGKITSSVSSISNGIKQLGVELPEGLEKTIGAIQVVAGILTGISSLVTVITAIQGVKSVPIIGEFLAGGGIIKAAGGTLVGTHYSGDNLRGIGPGGQIYGLNAGEVVLNRSQVGNLASQLEGGQATVESKPYITGELLFLGINNYLKREGYGELVTTRG